MSGATPQSIARERAASACGMCGDIVARTEHNIARSEQPWADVNVRARLQVLRRARLVMAAQAADFAGDISPALARTQADTLVTEVLPLLDACRFLERNAAKILRPRKLGRAGRSLWLTGVEAEVHREPLGHVLVIGPANFPLFLAGTQVLQALAAGNRVTWKPGAGGQAVALRMAQALKEAGLPAAALRVSADTIATGKEAPAERPDKVVFTGSEKSGVSVLNELARSATPAVVELSGADAIIVLPSADLALVAEAVAFGLRLNGGAVCMSPRRLLASAATLEALRPKLIAALKMVGPVELGEKTAEKLRALLNDATAAGGVVHGVFAADAQQPLIVDRGTPQMAIAQSDVFAPVITLIEVPSLLHVKEAYEHCPYALTASIFCGPQDVGKARMLAATLRAGTVLINDVIAPTADARVPFGGRGASGYGVTRGAEGLLEMTAVKTLLVRKRGTARHYMATTDADVPIFMGMIRISHGRTFGDRLTGLKQLIQFGRKR